MYVHKAQHSITYITKGLKNTFGLFISMALVGVLGSLSMESAGKSGRGGDTVVYG